jgi:hypothetical protein
MSLNAMEAHTILKPEVWADAVTQLAQLPHCLSSATASSMSPDGPDVGESAWLWLPNPVMDRVAALSRALEGLLLDPVAITRVGAMELPSSLTR